MKLIKTTFFSGFVVLIRVATGFVANKVVAIYTGTSGIALIGAFSNLIAIIITFANGAINNGVIKYTAENESNDDKLKTLFSAAFKITFFCSVFTGTVLFFFSTLISNILFKTNLFIYPIRIFAFSVILFSLNSLFIAILNGKLQIKLLTIVNTFGSVVGMILSIILVYHYNLKGALYALVISQSIVFFITLFFIRKCDWFNISFFNQNFDANILKSLSHYSLMAIVTTLTVPISQIIIRNMLISSIGLQSAGIWQGMMRISDGYLLLFTTSLATYYLPKLSSLQTDNELRSEILQGYKLIIPAVLVSCSAIFILRSFIIEILYTPDFIPMSALFFYQLVGDFFKIAAYILGYIIVAKTMIKHFILTEIGFTILYIILAFTCVSIYGLEGMSIAFAVTYFIYFIVMVVIFKDILFRKPK